MSNPLAQRLSTPPPTTTTEPDTDSDAPISYFSDATPKMLYEPMPHENRGSLHLLEDTETEDGQLNAIRHAVKIRVAMDSGACKSVAHPSVMPSGVAVTPHTGGKHFSGAAGKTIERCGQCTTLLKGKHGGVQCRWNLASVARSLHAVCQIAGPYKRNGNHYLFLRQ